MLVGKKNKIMRNSIKAFFILLVVLLSISCTKEVNNEVIFDVTTKDASLSTNDIRHFYNELGKNQQFTLSGKIYGALNDFTAKNLYLKDTKNSVISGTVNFKNLFAKKGNGEFYMKGAFAKVSSNYDDLITLLPNVLGKNLPSSLKKFGQFNLNGKAEVTKTSIDTDFILQTKLGMIASKLVSNEQKFKI